MRSQAYVRPGVAPLIASEPSRNQHQASQRQENFQRKKKKVFITGLSNEMTKRGLIKYFKSIYPSTVNFIMKRLGVDSKKISGFGFLILKGEKHLDAILERRLFYYKRRHLRAEPYLKDQGLEKHKECLENKRIFIGRVPENINSVSLWRILEEDVGSVENAYVVTNTKRHKKKHKGFGYAIFASPDIAKRALEMKELYVERLGIFLNFEKVKGKKNLKKEIKFNKGPDERVVLASQDTSTIQVNERMRNSLQNQINSFYPGFDPAYKVLDTQSQGEGRSPKDHISSIQVINTFGQNSYGPRHSHPQRNLPYRDTQGFYEGRTRKNKFSSFIQIDRQLTNIEKDLAERMRFSGQNVAQQNFRNKTIQKNNNIQFKRKKHSTRDLKLITAKNGWKEHSLRMLNHSDTNVRLNPLSDENKKRRK